jgi:hypothetical protein
VSMVEDCVYCDEPIHGEQAEGTIFTEEGPRHGHWQCALREVLGGIGHHIAHEYWCGAPRHDPDAGLTRRQSALLVAAWVQVMGVERSVV